MASGRVSSDGSSSRHADDQHIGDRNIRDQQDQSDRPSRNALLDRSQTGRNVNGWSIWSMWSDCISECIVSGQDRTPVGFHYSTRKCLSASGCPGSRIRLKLCNAETICSSTRPRYTLDQYVNSLCDADPATNRSAAVINGCFIKNCPNNELILSHELQLPNTSPCTAGDSGGSANSYCYSGECRHFDCSGYSESNTVPCKDKTGKLIP